MSHPPICIQYVDGIEILRCMKEPRLGYQGGLALSWLDREALNECVGVLSPVDLPTSELPVIRR